MLVQPIGRVAYPGTTVHYSCEGTGTTTLNVNDELVVGDTLVSPAAVQTYQNRQFSWIRTPSNGGTTRWDLSVLANAENNNTRIKCYFNSAITKEVVLVVVDGEWNNKQKLHVSLLFSSHRSTRPSCSSLSDSDQPDCPHSHLDCTMATPCHQLHCDHAQPHVKPDYSVDCN